MNEAVSGVRLPDGQQVQLGDWTTSSLYSSMTRFVEDEALTLDGTRVELGYTYHGGEPPPKVVLLTLYEWSQKSGCSYWDLRSHVAEYLSRERRGLRSEAQWRRMYQHLDVGGY